MDSTLKKSRIDRAAADRATLSALLLNPVTLLIGGFVASNVLEQTSYGKTKFSTTETQNNNPLRIIFPQWSIFFPDKKITTPAGTPINLLTADQANVLRTALVAYALGSGFAPLVKGLKNG